MNKIKLLQCILLTIGILNAPFPDAKTFAEATVYQDYDNSTLLKAAIKPVKINWKQLQRQSDLLDKYVNSRRGNFDNLKIPSHLQIKLPNGLIYDSRNIKDASFANILRRIGGKIIILHGIMDEGAFCYLAIRPEGILYEISTNKKNYPITGGMEDTNYVEFINLTIDKIVKQNSKFYFYTAKGVYLIDVNKRSLIKTSNYPRM